MSTHRGQHLLLVLVTLAALTACSSQRERLIQQGATPAYAEGYVDGCDSGKQAGGAILIEAKKDADRYVGSSEYAKGWDEAFEKCQADTATRVREARRRNPHRNK
ncbi:MAG: hypothetical protein ACR2QH_06190 [Geminicoccaceae bacterium]